MIGIVRYTMKMDMKVSMRMMVGGRKSLLVINFRSSNGERTFLSMAINAASEAPAAAKRPAA